MKSFIMGNKPVILIGGVVIFIILFIFPFKMKKLDAYGDPIVESTNYGVLGIKRVVKSYSRDGNVNGITPYLFGKYHGRLTLYYNESTQVMYSIDYSLNKIVNVIEMYDEKGNALDFGSISNGNGELKAYYGNGKLRNSGMVVNGFKDGFWYSYNNAGVGDSTLYDKGYKMLRGSKTFFNLP